MIELRCLIALIVSGADLSFRKSSPAALGAIVSSVSDKRNLTASAVPQLIRWIGVETAKGSRGNQNAAEADSRRRA